MGTINIVRHGIVGVIAVLSYLGTVYTGWTWIPAVIGALGVFTTYGLPSLQQLSFTGKTATPPVVTPPDTFPYTIEKGK